MTKVRISNNSGEVTGFRVRDFQYMTIGKFILNRLLNNRDVKMLITSSGNTTGTGKTQLAIILSRTIAKYAQEIYGSNYDWNAEDHSFMNVYEYLEKYEGAQEGEVLITDEMEYLADNRRSMSNQNVHFSQAWQMLRYKNVVTVGTAPSMANLDIRIPENTDIWINIVFPGLANVYYISMDDFTGERKFKRLKQMGFVETIRWKPIDGDEDYETLTNMKANVGIPGMTDNEEDEIFEEQDMEQARKKTEKEVVRDHTIRLLEMKQEGEISLNQEEIAELVDRSQQYVSKIKRKEIPAKA